MLQCERYYPATGAIKEITPDAVPALLHDADAVLWIDVAHPTDEDFAWLAQTFALHPLASEDLRNQEQRPKVDAYENHLFVVLRTAHFHPDTLQISSNELDLIIGDNYLVTVHRLNIPVLDQVRQRWLQTHPPGEATPFLFYLVLDGVVDSYFPLVDEIGDVIDDIDADIFTDSDEAAVPRIFTLRRSLLTVRKLLGPTRDAVNELIRVEEDRLFAVRHLRAYFTDVYDHVLRLTDFIDTYRDMLSGSLEAYQSTLANRLNRNMQRLTVAATVLATATVVTGFYGMNLQGLLINSAWPYGGHLLLAVLVIVTLVEIWLFRRKGWL